MDGTTRARDVMVPDKGVTHRVDRYICGVCDNQVRPTCVYCVFPIYDGIAARHVPGSVLCTSDSSVHQTRCSREHIHGPYLVVTGSTNTHIHISHTGRTWFVRPHTDMSRSCMSQTLATHHYVTYPGHTIAFIRLPRREGARSSGIPQAYK